MSSHSRIRIASADVSEPDLEFTTAKDAWPLIPPGRHQVQYCGFKKRRSWGGAFKLFVDFEIVNSEDPERVPNGTRIFRAYNLYDKLPPGSDLYKDLVLLNGKRVRKNAKLKLSLFKGKILDVQVRTVQQNRIQTELAEHQQYSVVESIIRIAAGAPGYALEGRP